MSANHTPVRRPRRWLLLVGTVLSLLSIAVLWPLQSVGQVCVMIYPAPPGCGAPEPRWVPLVATGLVIATLAAMVVIAFSTARPVRPMLILAATMVLITAIAVGTVALSQTGIWDPYQPPVIVN